MENTIPNIKQSALEYFVYTIRDRRERRKLLRFAQKHYTPSENFIWGPLKKEQSEGSKAQSKALPTSGHNTQTSLHKKSKDSKTSCSADQAINKVAEDKTVAPQEPGEETDRPSSDLCSDAARPRNTENAEDSNPEDINSQLEKKLNNSSEEKESASPKNNEEGDDHNKDCENAANAGSHDDDLLLQ